MAETVSNTVTKDPTNGHRPEGTRGGLYFTPRVDIIETDKELTVFADVPGVRPEDVDMHYEKGELVLRARVSRPTPEKLTLMTHEYQVGDFYRAFSIHESIDTSRIEAECKNGVLTVHLPKVEAVRPRQITVRNGA
jgi:HSP20 family protein